MIPTLSCKYKHKARLSTGAASLVLSLAISFSAFGQDAPAGKPTRATSAPKEDSTPRSSLPAEALKQAQQAEQHLAANEPDQAIAILQGLDKQYPGNSAISLRLAEIHDTLSRYGYALFYYRRYIKLAGPKAREMAAARVQSLELMAGIDDDAAAAAQALGESTVPVMTPTPRVQRMLAAATKDGDLVPINSEEDLKNIRKLTAKASASPAPTPTHTPIVIPETLTATPAAATPAPRTSQAGQAAMAISAAEASGSPKPSNGSRPAGAQPRDDSPKVSVSAKATPRPPDQDALLAKAFVSADSPDSVTISTPTPAAGTGKNSEEQPMAGRQVPAAPDNQEIPEVAKRSRAPEPEPTTVPSLGDAVAYTKATPTSESPRAASFFHITKSHGHYAQVVILNNLPQGVVTMSIVPPDDQEVLSAILMPGETKTLYVNPGTYQVNAKASTTDYSPITLMSAQFRYKFEAGRQYTRRVTNESIQRVN